MSDQPEKLALASASISDAQHAKLRELFPEIFTEAGKIDFERLKRSLGETVDAGKERFGLTWPGKADCFKTIQQPSTATLRPILGESVNFDTTGNVIIEGDNLEVLKLLQKSYLGKVKMIYIDPPYNTGNDFIYPDNYSESLDTYLRYTEQVDSEGRKYSVNTEADGRFHSRWLNMMYPRLFLARNLLRDDGVIFISIDDHEADNLRKLCNELFGEENFVAQIVWEKIYTTKNDSSLLSTCHDYQLCYTKNAAAGAIGLLPRTEEMDARYSNPDNDPRGVWKAIPLYADGERKNGRYKINGPTGRVFEPPADSHWRYVEADVASLVADNRISFGKDGNAQPNLKRFLTEVRAGVKSKTIWFHKEVGSNDTANRELKELFPEGSPFTFPKPTGLVKRMLQISSSSEDSIILDFFGGSGTTADAVLSLNKEDGAKRKFILVQLPEPTQRQDFPTIADITKERVRRVITKLNESEKGNLSLGSDSMPDRGFKVFKLQSSNFKVWNADVAKEPISLAQQLEMHVQHIVDGRNQEDLLFEILLKSGFPLNTIVESLNIAGKPVFAVEQGAMLVCLDKELTPAVIQAMADRQPVRVICLDAGFAGNDQLKTNAVQQMRARGVTKFQTV